MEPGILTTILHSVREGAEEVRDRFDHMGFTAEFSPWRLRAMVDSTNPFIGLGERLAAISIAAGKVTPQSIDRDPSLTWWHKQVIKSAFRSARRFDRLVALTYLLEQRGDTSTEYTSDEVQRAFYALKAMVALALGRQTGKRDHNHDDVCVAFWNCRDVSTETGEGQEWTDLRVPQGLRGWTYEISNDSSL